MLLLKELTSGSRDAAFSVAGQEPACKGKKSELTLPPRGHKQKYLSGKATSTSSIQAEKYSFLALGL